jgi:hypothetical protein
MQFTSLFPRQCIILLSRAAPQQPLNPQHNIPKPLARLRVHNNHLPFLPLTAPAKLLLNDIKVFLQPSDAKVEVYADLLDVESWDGFC